MADRLDVIPLFAAPGERTARLLRFDEAAGASELAPQDSVFPAGEEGGNLLEITVQAYAEGFARGRADGRAAAMADLEVAARHLLSAAEAVAAHRARSLESAREELVELALAVASRVIRAEAESGRDLARRLAELGIARLGACTRLTVRLHPEDVRWVSEALSGTREGLSFVPDPEVGRGGALVEGEFGKVDARLETQLEEVRLALSREER